MFRHLPSLKALHVFESAARLGSFAAAAQELAVSPGAVSYQIRQLEEALCTPLFERLTRQVILTESGQALFRTSHRQFRELADTVEQIAPSRSTQTLTVSVSTYFVTRWLSPRLGEFLTEHPSIVIRLQHAVNDPGFRLQDADIAIKWGDGQWPDSHSELLFTLPMIAVCCPALIQKNAKRLALKDLSKQTLLRDQSPVDYWMAWLEQAGIPTTDINGPVIVDPNVRVQSAVDGHGFVLANPLINELIDNGKLCEPFNIRLDGYGYHLVVNDRINDNSAFQRFRKWLLMQVG